MGIASDGLFQRVQAHGGSAVTSTRVPGAFSAGAPGPPAAAPAHARGGPAKASGRQGELRMCHRECHSRSLREGLVNVYWVPKHLLALPWCGREDVGAGKCVGFKRGAALGSRQPAAKAVAPASTLAAAGPATSWCCLVVVQGSCTGSRMQQVPSGCPEGGRPAPRPAHAAWLPQPPTLILAAARLVLSHMPGRGAAWTSPRGRPRFSRRAACCMALVDAQKSMARGREPYRSGGRYRAAWVGMNPPMPPMQSPLVSGPERKLHHQHDAVYTLN